MCLALRARVCDSFSHFHSPRPHYYHLGLLDSTVRPGSIPFKESGLKYFVSKWVQLMLSLCRSCLGDHSVEIFMGTVSPVFLEDIILQQA